MSEAEINQLRTALNNVRDQLKEYDSKKRSYEEQEKYLLKQLREAQAIYVLIQVEFYEMTEDSCYLICAFNSFDGAKQCYENMDKDNNTFYIYKFTGRHIYGELCLLGRKKLSLYDNFTPMWCKDRDNSP